MDLKDLFSTDLDKAKQVATQAGGNALFNFLGLSLQKEATEAGLELKTQFTPKIDENPEVDKSVAASVLGFSISNSLMLAGAGLLAAYFFLGKK